MRKISIGLCVLALALITACTCATAVLSATTTYKWSYNNTAGTVTSGEFTTNEYGQAMFDVPSDVDCNRVNIEEKKTPEIAPEESAT